MPLKDKQKETEYQRRKQTKRRAWLNSFKERPCLDCGVAYPTYVMHFDHKPEFIKDFTISVKYNYSVERLLAEIEKCDVVCANCHAERTHQRRSVAESVKAPVS